MRREVTYTAIFSAGSNGSIETAQSTAKYIISILSSSLKQPNAYTCCGVGAIDRCSERYTECSSCHVKFEIYIMNHRILADYYSAGINSDMFNHIRYAGTIIYTVLNILDMPKRDVRVTLTSKDAFALSNPTALRQNSLDWMFWRNRLKVESNFMCPAHNNIWSRGL